MSDTLRFEVELRPLGANNLYANGKPMRTRKGKTYVPRVAKTSTKHYKQAILNAAKAAAYEQGWELGYAGTASITIIDYRKGSRGLDVDGIQKAIADAIQPRRKNPVPTPIGNDREIWESRVLIANSDRPRIVVIVRKTTREAIAFQAAAADRGWNAVLNGVTSVPLTPVTVTANVVSHSRAELRSGDIIKSFAERDAILRKAKQ